MLTHTLFFKIKHLFMENLNIKIYNLEHTIPI